MNEKDKYLRIYSGHSAGKSRSDTIPGKMSGGYGRICWGENMLEPLKQWKIASLLDVGCGYGNFCDAAALFVPLVYGLDIASVATGNVIDNPEINYLDGEAKSLPLPGNAVEWITSFDCLEHCLEEDIDKILDEFDRVARKGFVLSISYAPCERDGLPLHMTVKPEAWWIDKLSRYGDVKKEGQTPITGAPYLICRKPVDPELVCYCAGGLGARLHAIARADALSRRTGRKLTLFWLENDPLCRAHFSKLFSNPIPEIREHELLQLPSCKIYARVKDVADQALISGGMILREAVRRYGCSDPESFAMDDVEDAILIFTPQPGAALSDKIPASCSFISRLSPTDHIKNCIEEAMSDLNIDKQCMGVHARGTDFAVDVDAYARQIERAIFQKPNQQFLVCSEDRTYGEKLKHRFQDHIAIRPKSDWMHKIHPNLPWALGNIDTTEASVIEAMIDLYLLGQTDFRIYHESSLYARFGALLSSVRPMVPAYPGKPADPKIRAQIDPGDPAASDIQPASSGHRACPAPIEINPKQPKNDIYYFCPDIQSKSAGIRRLYRHVAVLREAGLAAYILHEKCGFQQADMPRVPTRYLEQIGQDATDIFVIPEGMPRVMHRLKSHPGRRFAIALSWHYVFDTLPDGLDWRHLNIERVMVASPMIGRMISWSMGLPVHHLGSGIDHRRYCYTPENKRMQISYISRKSQHVEKLKHLLGSRNPDYIHKCEWTGLDDLSQDDYAAQIRRSSVFLTTSMAEGFPTSCLEAMAAGTIVAGYDAVGGKDMLRGQGADRNCILAPNGDYLALAYALAPLLEDLIRSRTNRWNALVSHGQQTASAFTAKSEADSLLKFWHQFGARPADSDAARCIQTG